MKLKRLLVGFAAAGLLSSAFAVSAPAAATTMEKVGVVKSLVVKANIEQSVPGRTCGFNQLCRILSTTTGYAYHYRDGGLSASFPSTTSPVGRSSTTASSFGSGLVRTSGTSAWVYSASSDCWCPPGVTCGV